MLRRKHTRGVFNTGDPFNLKSMLTPQLQGLRVQAYHRLLKLGYFSPEAKELQCFNLVIKANPNKFENPHLPDELTFQITTVQKPHGFVITRNHRIKGKRFDPKRCLEPFTFCLAEGVVFGPRGKAVLAEQYETILRDLISLDREPIKRPTK